MIAAAFVMMRELSVTTDCKLDRRALSALGRKIEGVSAPRTPTEAALSRIFCQVLRLEQVGPGDNFFHLGGDSIVTIQVVSLERREGLKLTPRDIFQHPTIEALAAIAETETSFAGTAGGSYPESAQSEIEQTLALSPMQEGLLFHSLYDPSGPDVYQVQACLELEGPLDPPRMRLAAEALLPRYANLPVAIPPAEAGRPVQVGIRSAQPPCRQAAPSQSPPALRP